MAFNLPTAEGETPIAFTGKGLVHLGEEIPYHELEKIKATSDDEVEFSFRSEREDLVFQLEEGCSHQILDLKTFVETALMQHNQAILDEKRETIVGIRNPDTGEEVPMTVFDTKKVKKSFAKAFAIGG